MEDRDIGDFTDADEVAIRVQALAAARACLTRTKEYLRDDRHLVHDILKAFIAVREVGNAAIAQRRAQYPDRRIGPLWLDQHAIVATAVCFMDAPEAEPHPHSEAGVRMRVFARACAALDAHAQIEGWLWDFESLTASPAGPRELLALMKPPAA